MVRTGTNYDGDSTEIAAMDHHRHAVTPPDDDHCVPEPDVHHKFGGVLEATEFALVPRIE